MKKEAFLSIKARTCGKLVCTFGYSWSLTIKVENKKKKGTYNARKHES
jgi:hypothetical protein